MLAHRIQGSQTVLPSRSSVITALGARQLSPVVPPSHTHPAARSLQLRNVARIWPQSKQYRGRFGRNKALISRISAIFSAMMPCL